MYQDESDPLLECMEITEMTTVLDSRLPRQRDEAGNIPDHWLRTIASVYAEHPDYRNEWSRQ